MAGYYAASLLEKRDDGTRWVSPAGRDRLLTLARIPFWACSPRSARIRRVRPPGVQRTLTCSTRVRRRLGHRPTPARVPAPGRLRCAARTRAGHRVRHGRARAHGRRPRAVGHRDRRCAHRHSPGRAQGRRTEAGQGPFSRLGRAQPGCARRAVRDGPRLRPVPRLRRRRPVALRGQSCGLSLRPKAATYLLCFSDHMPGTIGPRRVSQAEIRASFGDGWRVESIEPATFETSVLPVGAAAWLASITRLEDLKKARAE